MQQRIKLRYAENEMAILEQRQAENSSRISLSLYELRGVVDFLKNPTDAPYIFYSQHPEPLSVQFNGEDQSYQISRGEIVLSGVRGKPDTEEAVEAPQEESQSGRHAFQVFKNLMNRLSRKPPSADA